MVTFYSFGSGGLSAIIPLLDGGAAWMGLWRTGAVSLFGSF